MSTTTSKPKNTKRTVAIVLALLGFILLLVSLSLIFLSYQNIKAKNNSTAHTEALAAFGVGIAGAIFSFISWFLIPSFSPAILVFGIISVGLMALALYLMYLTASKISEDSKTSAEASALSAFIIGIIATIGFLIVIILIGVFQAGKTYVTNANESGSSSSGGTSEINAQEVLLKALAA